MMKPLAQDLGLFILRLTLGPLVLLHGIGKLINGVGYVQGVLQGAGLPASLAYGAYLGEVVGPILLIVGWYARIGAVLIAVNMLFAFGLVFNHALLSLNQFGGWVPELEGMFLFTAVALALTGPGRIAVDPRF